MRKQRLSRSRLLTNSVMKTLRSSRVDVIRPFKNPPSRCFRRQRRENFKIQFRTVGIKCGQYLRRLVEAQPDPTRRLYLQMDSAQGLIREYDQGRAPASGDADATTFDLPPVAAPITAAAPAAPKALASVPTFEMVFCVIRPHTW